MIIIITNKMDKFKTNPFAVKWKKKLEAKKKQNGKNKR